MLKLVPCLLLGQVSELPVTPLKGHWFFIHSVAPTCSSKSGKVKPLGHLYRLRSSGMPVASLPEKKPSYGSKFLYWIILCYPLIILYEQINCVLMLTVLKTKNFPHFLDLCTFPHNTFIQLYSYFRTHTNIGLSQGSTVGHSNKIRERTFLYWMHMLFFLEGQPSQQSSCQFVRWRET